MSRLNSLGLLVVALALSACVTNDTVGTSTVDTMSKSTKSFYTSYRSNLKTLGSYIGVFAYDPTTKRAGWSSRRGHTDAVESAIDSCGSPDCKVFDINGNIVWKGVNPNLVDELVSLRPILYDDVTREYETGIFTLSPVQIRRYEAYLKTMKRFASANSAFFVSVDGNSAGTSYSDNNSSVTYQASLDRARRQCLTESAGKTCYLFATGGEPINAAAAKVISEQSG